MNYSHTKDIEEESSDYSDDGESNEIDYDNIHF